MHIWVIQWGIQGGASPLFKSNVEALWRHIPCFDLFASKKRRITKNVLKVGPHGNYVIKINDNF